MGGRSFIRELEESTQMQIDLQKWRDMLRLQAMACNIGIDDTKIDLVVEFVSELITWNKKTNLTAITDPAEIAEKHIIDSLIPLKFIPENASILDIGTGGGFPGIPLKILLPELNVTLIDSSRKKINFLKYVIRVLNLQNISAHQYRVEELANHTDFAGQFDVVISRAFTSLKKFLILAAPLIKPDGVIIAMKGKDVHKELDELEAINPETNAYRINKQKLKLQIEKYRLPTSGDDRSLVIARSLFL